MHPTLERARLWAYALVAAAGFIAGMAMGQLCAIREPGHSRIAWPEPAHPRKIQP